MLRQNHPSDLIMSVLRVHEVDQDTESGNISDDEAEPGNS